MFCIFFCDMRVLYVPVCPRLGGCADRGHVRRTFTHVWSCSRSEAGVLSSSRGVHTDLGEESDPRMKKHKFAAPCFVVVVLIVVDVVAHRDPVQCGSIVRRCWHEQARRVGQKVSRLVDAF